MMTRMTDIIIRNLFSGDGREGGRKRFGARGGGCVAGNLNMGRVAEEESEA